MAFIVKEFDKYSRWDREHATYTFSINDNMYAVMRVRMEWGLPQVPARVEYEDDLGMYQVYETEEQAMEFVHLMCLLN